MEKETDHFYPHIPGIERQFASGGQHVVKLAKHELVPWGGGGVGTWRRLYEQNRSHTCTVTIDLLN